MTIGGKPLYNLLSLVVAVQNVTTRSIFAVNQHPGEAQACDLAGLKDSLSAAASGTLLCLDEAGMVLTRSECGTQLLCSAAY
jgi:hypothetical protein